MDEVQKAIREARKHHQKASDFDSKDGGMRQVAAMSEKQFSEMIDECGNDKEKQDRYLRDHPENLTASAKEHGLPKRKKYFYSK